MADRAHELPDLDLIRIERFCAARIPARAAHQVRLEVEVSGDHVTIAERRAPWSPSLGPEWTRTLIARLRYRHDEGTWALFWAGRNGAFHRYAGTAPTPTVDDLLREIERDPSGVFWG